MAEKQVLHLLSHGIFTIDLASKISLIRASLDRSSSTGVSLWGNGGRTVVTPWPLTSENGCFF